MIQFCTHIYTQHDTQIHMCNVHVEAFQRFPLHFGCKKKQRKNELREKNTLSKLIALYIRINETTRQHALILHIQLICMHAFIWQRKKKHQRGSLEKQRSKTRSHIQIHIHTHTKYALLEYRLCELWKLDGNLYMRRIFITFFSSFSRFDPLNFKEIKKGHLKGQYRNANAKYIHIYQYMHQVNGCDTPIKSLKFHFIMIIFPSNSDSIWFNRVKWIVWRNWFHCSHRLQVTVTTWNCDNRVKI